MALSAFYGQIQFENCFDNKLIVALCAFNYFIHSIPNRKVWKTIDIDAHIALAHVRRAPLPFITATALFALQPGLRLSLELVRIMQLLLSFVSVYFSG